MTRILTFKKVDGSYGAYLTTPTSHWWALVIYIVVNHFQVGAPAKIAALALTRFCFDPRLTALVVKVLSLLAERQMAGRGGGPQGHVVQEVANQDIITSVRFLVSVQKRDGSFSDPHPVYHREMDVSWLQETTHTWLVKGDTSYQQV